MTIHDKGLIKAMKTAYRNEGYDVALTAGTIFIQTDDWGVAIPGDAVPNSIKSLIVLHNGSMPRADEAVHVQKGDCGSMILDSVTHTQEMLAKSYTEKGGRRIKPTRLTLDGQRVWQLTDSLEVKLVDPEYQQIFIGISLDTYLVGKMIYSRNGYSQMYIRTDWVEPEDQVLLEHLAQMQWIPVELG